MPPSSPAAAAADTAPAPSAPKALRPVRLHTLTPAEQIAKHLGQGILKGDYGPGERIGEQAVADLFAVSRGPVRDALRLLEKQGLVEISPRRGTFVVEFVLNDVVDIFNVRGALLSLAVRYLASNPDKAVLAEIDHRMDELQQLALAAEPPLAEFIKAVGRVAIGMVQVCGNRQLIQTYRNLPHDAVWQMLWVNGPLLDYDKPARRVQSLREHERMLAAIRAGDAATGEAVMRKIMRDSCREVIEHMRGVRIEPVEAFRLDAS